jgi:hypothetical protein
MAGHVTQVVECLSKKNPCAQAPALPKKWAELKVEITNPFDNPVLELLPSVTYRIIRQNMSKDTEILIENIPYNIS